MKTQILKLAEKLGFCEWYNGGGYWALFKEMPNGNYILITDLEGDSIPSDFDEMTCLGLYDSEGDNIQFFNELDNIAVALAISIDLENQGEKNEIEK